MTELRSLSAPAIGEAGVRRLLAFTRPSRLKSDCTLFDAGYEQCKADFLLRINAEVTLPEIIEPVTTILSGDQYRQIEKNVARAKQPPRRWWQL